MIPFHVKMYQPIIIIYCILQSRCSEGFEICGGDNKSCPGLSDNSDSSFSLAKTATTVVLADPAVLPCVAENAAPQSNRMSSEQHVRAGNSAESDWSRPTTQETGDRFTPPPPLAFHCQWPWHNLPCRHVVASLVLTASIPPKFYESCESEICAS